MQPLLRLLMLLIAAMLFNPSAHANETINIVTDPWPPYAYSENNKLMGTDVDITMAVFKRMGITANIQLLPWKRCLNLVKALKADAILDVSVTEDRKSFLHFPDEPVSTGITVFFKKVENPLASIKLDNPDNIRAGAMLGYKYCDELDNSRLLANAWRVPNLEQNFKMLLLNRVDLVVEVESVGIHKAGKMGIADQLAIVPNARFCPGGNYLAFAKKPGYEKLTLKFSDELAQFKTTQEYKQILEKYEVAQ